MEERLLLDRIALERANIAARDHQAAATVVANLADAPKPLLDQAAVSARVTANLVVRQLLVERPQGALLDSTVERLGERGCLFGGHSLNIRAMEQLRQAVTVILAISAVIGLAGIAGRFYEIRTGRLVRYPFRRQVPARADAIR